MRILFLGDVVGISGRSMVLNNLLPKINEVPINAYDQKLDYIVTNKYIVK